MNGKVIALGFDQGDREVLMIENVISLLRFAACYQLAPHDNAALCEKDFSANLG